MAWGWVGDDGWKKFWKTVMAAVRGHAMVHEDNSVAPAEVQVCIDLASTALGLSHDGLSSHRAVLPAPLGAAVNKG